MLPPAVPRCVALVPCAGSGQRAGTAGPKQYALLGGRAVVAHTLRALAAVGRIEATLVVLSPEDVAFEAHAPGFAGPCCWIDRHGGATRAASVRAGLRALRGHGVTGGDWVLVHDAARCLVEPASIDRLLDACLPDAVGGVLALPLADTLKAARDGRITATLPRDDRWLAQTPQMFRLELLERALDAALEGGRVVITDEAGAVEALGLAPLLVPGSAMNMKLTWPADFALAERLLAPA